MTSTSPRIHTVLTATAIALLALALVPAALGKGKPSGGSGGGGGGGSTCTQNAPGVAVQNNWAWAQTGSWGMPGQQLDYQIQVLNYDSGCSSSTFTISVSAPDGFSVSVPTSAISLNSSSSGYLWAYVTSPTVTGDGDYPLTVTVARAGAAGPSAARTTYYKLYSSDSGAPTLFWSNPGNGQTISGSSYVVNVSSSDDHAVKKIDLYLDGAHVTSTACDDITYICQLSYKLSLSHMSGQHTATFRSTDWMGNVGVSTVAFTVS
jgi:hypothetical protein